MSIRGSGSSFDFSKIDEGIGFQGDLDQEYLIKLQENRTAYLQSLTFEGAVNAKLGMIPSYLRREVYRRQKEWMEVYPDYEYVEWAGRPLGTPENPVYGNLKEDPDYDPHLRQVKKVTKLEKDPVTGEEVEVELEEVTYGEPILISPKPTIKEEIDYYKLNTIIGEVLEKAGLSWKLQRLEVFTGEEWDPSMDEAFKDFDPEEDEEEETEVERPTV